ncbi:MAG: hypothetical protein KDD44_15405, partial [Bdellovibrionales bacterium]|nr:hypothetical protein [Bdellovibrionales bacterium]
VGHAPELEIGILVRSNRWIPIMLRALRQRGIFASEEGGNPLTDSEAVTLILALLTLADSPGSTVAAYRVASSALAALFPDLDWQAPDARERVASQLRRQLIDDGYGRSLSRWIRALRGLVPSRDQARLEQLAEFAYVYDNQSTLRPSDFVRAVRMTKIEAPRPAAIRVMTIHQSKGLEFDAVILPELDGAIARVDPFQPLVDRSQPLSPPSRISAYPNKLLQQADPRLAELYQHAQQRSVRDSLCVLYVALTRARHALYLFTTAREKAGSIPTSADLIREGLTEGAAVSDTGRLCEIGDPNWWSPS